MERLLPSYQCTRFLAVRHRNPSVRINFGGIHSITITESVLGDNFRALIESARCAFTPSITMYIWKVNALIRDLRQGHISRFDKVKYGTFLLIMTSLCWLGIDDPDLDPAVSGISICAAQLFSIYICHCTNTHGDDRDFWVRLCALGIPVGLRLLCVMTFAIFLSSLPDYMVRKVLGAAADLMPILSSMPSALVLTFGILVWGIRVSAHIDRVANSSLQSSHAGIVSAFTASSR